jgi:hypothetical protein
MKETRSFKHNAPRNPAMEVALKHALSLQRPKIQDAPCVGNILVDKIQHAVDSVSIKHES